MKANEGFRGARVVGARFDLQSSAFFLHCPAYLQAFSGDLERRYFEMLHSQAYLSFCIKRCSPGIRSYSCFVILSLLISVFGFLYVIYLFNLAQFRREQACGKTK